MINMKTRLTLTPLKEQERYEILDRLLKEGTDILAKVAIIGAIIIIWVSLWVIFQPKIKAALFMANEFIKPVWGG